MICSIVMIVTQACTSMNKGRGIMVIILLSLFLCLSCCGRSVVYAEISRVFLDEEKNELQVSHYDEGYCTHAMADCGPHPRQWVDFYMVVEGRIIKYKTVEFEYNYPKKGYFTYPDREEDE